jgi:hypothetical protein
MSELRALTKLKADRAIEVLNQIRLDLLKLRAGTVYHASATDEIVDGYGDGYVLRTNSYVTAYSTHIASVCDASTGVGAHISEDSTNIVSAPVATDLASAITRANELKADFNSHITLTGAHAGVADSIHTVSASDATDEASLLTLLDDLLEQLNGHFAGSFTADAIELIAP